MWIYGHIKSANRIRMGHHVADQLVYCQESFSLHLRQNLQNAGWKPEVERWESDEESDDKLDNEDHEQVVSAATGGDPGLVCLGLCAYN